jgi:hypothetical protein
MNMSINRMSEEQAKQLLHEIAGIFSIGSAARDAEAITQNARIASRRSQCLSLISQYHN